MSNPFALARRTRAWSERGVLVAGSGFLRRTLLDAGVPPDRVVVVHPVPPEETEARVPPPEDQVVAFVGQIIRGKGLDLLVQALSTRPTVRLIVAGEGNDRPHVEQMIRQLGMGGRVEMRGAIGPDRVREVYDAARVVVVPSRWPEPFGMVGVEAMRRGRVVVGAWHGGIPEWLAEGETGFGFRPGDVRDLGVALDRALRDGVYQRLAQAAVGRAAAGFGFAQMVAQVESVLG